MNERPEAFGAVADYQVTEPGSLRNRKQHFCYCYSFFSAFYSKKKSIYEYHHKNLYFLLKPTASNLFITDFLSFIFSVPFSPFVFTSILLGLNLGLKLTLSIHSFCFCDYLHSVSVPFRARSILFQNIIIIVNNVFCSFARSQMHCFSILILKKKSRGWMISVSIGKIRFFINTMNDEQTPQRKNTVILIYPWAKKLVCFSPFPLCSDR